MLGGRFIFQFFGWRVAAALTPLLMLVSGGAFFGLSLFGGSAGGAAAASTGALVGAVTQVGGLAVPPFAFLQSTFAAHAVLQAEYLKLYQIE